MLEIGFLCHFFSSSFFFCVCAFCVAMASLSATLERKFRGAEKGVEEDTWEYKMCKKIAQLTKVIYTLNCRTEDNEARMKWIQESHQHEVDRLISEYEKKLAEIAEKVKRIDASKTASIYALEENHKRMLSEIQKDLSERAEKLASELERRRNSLNESLKVARKNYQEDSENEIIRIKALKDKEIENLVKEYNEKYNAMLLEQLNGKDTMEAELNRSWGEKVADLNSSVKILQDSLQKAAQEAAQALKQQKDENSTLSSNIKLLEKHVQTLESSKRELASEKEDLLRKLEIERNASSSAHSSEADLRRKLNETQSELHSVTQDLRVAKDFIAEAEKKYEKSQANCVALQNAASIAETAKNAAQNETAGVKDELEKLKRNYNDLENRLSSLSNRADCSQADVENLMQKLSIANVEVDKMKNELSSQSQKHERAITACNQEWEERLSSERQKCIQEQSALRATGLERVKQEYQEQQDLENRKMFAAHEEAMKELKKMHQEAIVKLEDQLQNARNQGGSLGDELQGVKSALTVLKKQFNDRTEAYDDLLKTSTAKEQQDRKKIAELERAISLLRIDGQASENEHQKQLSALKGKMEEEMKKLRQQYDCEIREKNQASNTSMELLSQKHSQELEALKKDHAEAVHAVQSSASNALSEKERNLMHIQDSLRQKIQEHEVRYTEMERILNAKVDQLKKALDNAELSSAENSKRGQEELHRVMEELAHIKHEMEELRVAHERELHGVQERETTEKRREIENLSNRHKDAQNVLKLEIEELKEKYTADAIRFRNELEELKNAQERHREEEKIGHRKRMEDELEKLRNEHSREMRLLGDQFQASQGVLQSEICLSQQSLSDEKAAHGKTEEKRQEALAQMEGLRRIMEKEKATSEEVLRDLQEKYALSTSDLLHAHQTEISRLQLEHKSYVGHLKKEEKLKEDQHSALVEKLREALSELQYKYDYRESRNEDLELINRLLKENKEVKKELEKAYSDMKYFKLELINREENYNKLFGRRPVVAASSMSAESDGNRRHQESGPRTRAALSLPDIGKQHSGFNLR